MNILLIFIELGMTSKINLSSQLKLEFEKKELERRHPKVSAKMKGEIFYPQNNKFK